MRIILILGVLPLLAAAQAEPTYHIGHHGRLLDENDNPVTAALSITFSIYDESVRPQQNAHPALWEATREVSVTKGVYATSFEAPQSLFDGPEDLWLTFKIAGEPSEMEPRLRIGVVPRALNAVRLGGLEAGDFALADHTHSGLGNFYTKAEVDAALALKADASALAGKADASSLAAYATTTQLNDALALKADADDLGDYYTEGEVDGLLAGKADTHAHPYLSSAGGTLSGNLTLSGTAPAAGVLEADRIKLGSLWLRAGTTGKIQVSSDGATWANVKLESAFRFRVPVTVTAGAADIPADATLSVTINHASLVSAGKSLASGDDVRVFTPEDQEVARVADRALAADVPSWNTTSTRIDFRAGRATSAGQTATYFIYYGNSNPGAPPADPTQVYKFLYDDFTDGNFSAAPAWSHLTSYCNASVVSQKVELTNFTATSGNNFEACLNYAVGGGWGDYALEVDMQDNGSNGNSYPGPMVRLQDASVSNTTGWWFEMWHNHTDVWIRPIVNNSDGANINTHHIPVVLNNAWHRYRYVVIGFNVWGYYDGTKFINGYNMPTSQRVASGGVSLTNHTSGAKTTYDNVKVTVALEPPPGVAAGPEQAL